MLKLKSPYSFILIQIFIITACFSNSVYAQIGINTENPKASLDINPNTGTTTPHGVLIPRLTGTEVEAMTVDTDHNSLLVYATEPSTAATPVVNAIGFWFYDVVDSTWKPINIERRKSTVIVNPDGTGDYTTLQEAYNKEAEKLFKTYTSNGNLIEFLQFTCHGNVGSLTANGAIPYIKIVGGTNCVINSLNIYNTTLTTQGTYTVTGSSSLINSYFKMNSNTTANFSQQLTLKKALFETETGCNINTGNKINLVQSALILTSSSANTTNITFTPTTSLDAGLSLSNSIVKTGTSTTLAFEGSNSFTNYILCDDQSLLNAQCTIRANAPVTGSIVVARQASKACLTTITGTATPSKIFQAITGGKIEHYNGSITMSVTGNAFTANNGGEINLGGGTTGSSANSVITYVGSGTESAVAAEGGDVKVVTTPTQNSRTYTFNNFNLVLYAFGGGKIITLGRMLQGTSTTLMNGTAGTYLASGSAIFTGS